jgi:hypothetical protein
MFEGHATDFVDVASDKGGRSARGEGLACAAAYSV